MEKIKSLIRRIKELLPKGIDMFQKNDMSVFSGYATLFIVTAVFPFIILIISVVNLIPGYSAADVADALIKILPDLEGISDLVVNLVEEIKDQSGGLLASAAAVTTLWSASKGVMAIQRGLNEIDENTPAFAAKAQISDTSETNDTKDTKEEKVQGLLAKGMQLLKVILKRLLFTLMLIILIPAMLLIEMLGDSLANTICSLVQKIDPKVKESTLSTINSLFDIGSIVILLLAVLIVLQFYAALPAIRRTLKSQLPGSILTVVSWFIFTDFFAIFIKLFYHASSLYGSLAALFMLILWLRYMVMILFVGAVLNRVLEEEAISF